jgi:hypothetical protein
LRASSAQNLGVKERTIRVIDTEYLGLQFAGIDALALGVGLDPRPGQRRRLCGRLLFPGAVIQSTTHAVALRLFGIIAARVAAPDFAFAVANTD